MTAREEFEVWAEKMGMDLSTAFFIENAAYLDDDTDIAYRSWQASRAAALEEAAKECERAPDKQWLVARLRTLKEAP